MKAQQILHSFLPGVTAAVLTTQPTWADTVTVDNSHSGIYKSVFATSISVKDALKNTFYSTPITVDKNNYVKSKTVGFDFGNLKPVNSNSFGVRVSANNFLSKNEAALPLWMFETADAGEPRFNNRGLDRKPSFLRNSLGKAGALIKALEGNHQNTKTISLKEALKKSSSQNSSSQNSSSQNFSSQNFSYRQNNASQSPAAIKKNADEKILQKLKQIASGSGTAELLEVKSCPIQEDRQKRGQDNSNNSKLQTILSASVGSACQGINTIADNKIAQPLSPAPVQPTRPGLQGPAQIPKSLEPSANPLQYPTKPEEVRVEQNQPITLQQAIELARRNNQELQASLLQLERAQAGVKVQQAALLPSVGLNAQIARSQSSSSQRLIELGSTTTTDEPTDNFTGGVQLNYDLYTSGARLARIRQAEEQLRSQELDVERLSEEIRLSVATEYYNLQQADEQVRISRAAVENAEISLRDARALEEAGVRPRFDTLQAQVNLANAQQELTNARSDQTVARRQLATRLNLAQSATITAADSVKLAGLWNPTLEQSIVLAYQNRPELQQQLAQRNINEQQRRLALSALGPQVRVVANYELLDQFDDSVGITDGYSIALVANLNLFDGGASRAQAAQAKADIEVAETQFSQQRNNIRLQVEEAFSSLKSNLENVQTSEAALEQATESVRLARLRFQAGVGTQLEVINAENALTRAEGNRINAILDYNRALARLQRAVTSRGLR